MLTKTQEKILLQYVESLEIDLNLIKQQVNGGHVQAALVTSKNTRARLEALKGFVSTIK